MQGSTSPPVRHILQKTSIRASVILAEIQEAVFQLLHFQSLGSSYILLQPSDHTFCSPDPSVQSTYSATDLLSLAWFPVTDLPGQGTPQGPLAAIAGGM